LEQLIVNPIRSKRRRALAFDALEGRLVLSTGIRSAAAAHPAAAIMMAKINKSIPSTFKGRVQFPSASQILFTGLTGKIGKDRFTGYATGSTSGTLFLGGDVFLSNSQGTAHLQLGPAITVKAGKHPRQKVGATIVDGTGKYAQFVGGTGTLTTWNVPQRPNALATFGGNLRP
jgi:hypothetical protein